jgi:hypothetical protein
LIQRCDTDGVSGGNDPVTSITDIMQDETEESVEFGGAFDFHFFVLLLARTPTKLAPYQMKNNFTVRMSLECMRFLEPFPESAMVVYLAIDGKNQRVVAVGNWLCTRL